MESIVKRSVSPQAITLCLISDSRAVADDVQAVVSAINRLLDVNRIEEPAEDTDASPVYRSLLVQAGQALQRQRRQLPDAIEVLRFTDREDCQRRLSSEVSGAVDILVADCVRTQSLRPYSASDDQEMTALIDTCRNSGCLGKLSPHSLVIMPPERSDEDWHQWLRGNRQVRFQRRDENTRADLLRIVMDHLDHSYCNKMLARTISERFEPVSTAVRLVQFMIAHWGEQWDCHYFTGSMVSGFIQSVQLLTEGKGIRCLSGCSEHSLAVSALAAWQLFNRASLIVVTSGMLDEFRGTLANMKRAGVPCLVVCADSPSSMWFAFQGTMDPESDGRDVLRARGLTEVFIERPDEAPALLDRACQRLLDKPQPVFILATQGVLEHRNTRTETGSTVCLPKAPVNTVPEVPLAQAMAIINDEQKIILWQCGSLTPEEQQLVQSVAQRAGIFLVDSLTAPGSVPEYQSGRKNPAYLGTLAMYGFNRRVYYCLHDDSGLKDRDTQCLFFLKSRLDQAATPFSEGKLKRQLHIAQVNHNPGHISPFTDLPLVMDLKEFLMHVEQNLAVKPDVLAWREAERQRLQALKPEVSTDSIATCPMTVNYFFLQLGQLVTELIEQDGYHYMGVYDVGRCGLSAVRNVPRTRRGFSGWYGRALMGDALVALPYIAMNTDDNILAFIGDGARALVPNIESWLIENVALSEGAERRNVTVFYLNNGVLSLIQTYLDKRYSHDGADQVRVRPQRSDPATFRYAGITVHRDRISLFDHKALRRLISTRGQVNFLDVTLSHNSEGDGLSLLSESAWNRRFANDLEMS